MIFRDVFLLLIASSIHFLLFVREHYIINKNTSKTGKQQFYFRLNTNWSCIQWSGFSFILAFFNILLKRRCTRSYQFELYAYRNSTLLCSVVTALIQRGTYVRDAQAVSLHSIWSLKGLCGMWELAERMEKIWQVNYTSRFTKESPFPFSCSGIDLWKSPIILTDHCIKQSYSCKRHELRAFWIILVLIAGAQK